MKEEEIDQKIHEEQSEQFVPQGPGLEQLIYESEPLTEQQLYMLTELLFDKTKLPMISDINKEQIKTLVNLKYLDLIYVQKYCKGFKLIDDLIDTYLLFPISKDRKGREEIITMLKRLEEIRKEKAMEAKKGLFRR